MSDPVGIRNNNPGNLEVGGPIFVGEVDPPDGIYLRFIDPPHGLRAIIERLKAYQLHDGCKTIRTMISRWAPPPQNPTAAYIADVCAEVGIDQDTIVDLHDPVTQAAFMRAITKQENGIQPYSGVTIAKAVALVAQ
jgi:hypothetical protein